MILRRLISGDMVQSSKMQWFILLLVLQVLLYTQVAVAVMERDPAQTVIPHHAVRRGLSPHHYTGDRSYLHQALLRAVKENQLRVCVVGGSVPFGHGLKNRQVDAWPSRAREHLEDLLAPLRKKHQEEQDEESFTVDVVNLARPAQGSYFQAQTADDMFWSTLEACHVIIVDITVNDSEHVMSEDEVESRAVLAEGRYLMQMLLMRLIYPNAAVHAGDKSGNLARGLLYFETFTNSPIEKSFSGLSRKLHRSQEPHVKPSSHQKNSLNRRAVVTQGNNLHTKREGVAARPVIDQFLPTKKKNPHLFSHKNESSPIIHSEVVISKISSLETEHKITPSKCPFDVTEFRHWPALRDYQIPTLSWPDVVCFRDVRLDLYDSFPHPRPLYHRYMGQVVGIGLFELLLQALLELQESESLSPVLPLEEHRLQQARLALWPMLKEVSNINASALAARKARRQQVESLVLSEFHSSPFVSSNCLIEERLTLLSGSQPKYFKPKKQGSIWSFGEDIFGNDKHGWIAYNESTVYDKSISTEPYYDDESEITFGFKSKRNILKVGVLHSYDSRMGTLACCVDCDKFVPSLEIDTHWSKTKSVECLHSFKFAETSIPMRRLNMTDHNGLEFRQLKCRVSHSDKVKLLTIISC